MDSSKGLVLKGVIWSGVQIIVNQGFAFIIRLVLAKLLFPEQFGLIGMAVIFTGFVQVLNDLGIGAALVQKKDEDLRNEHFHTAFWTGIGWSISLYVIMSFLISKLAADFYNEPMLIKLIPVLSLGILCSPINLVHKAQLTKSMSFKKIAFIDNTSNIIAGCIAMALAFLGMGVWSLVFNSVASIVISMPLYFKATKWFPKLIWDKNAFKEIFGFGVYTTGTSVANYFVNNVDYLLIGKLLSAQALGAYTFAFILTDTFRSRLMLVVNNVMYPMYGRNQGDPIALKRFYLKVVNYNSILIYPIMVFLVALGDPFTTSVFGAKWHDSIAPLQVLSISVMIHMLVNSNTALIRGMGRPGLEMKLQLFKAAIFIPMLVAGIYAYGVIGAAWAVLINKFIAVIIAQFTFNKLLNIKISTGEFLAAIKVPWIAASLAYIITVVTYNFLHLHYIFAGLLLFGSYSLCVWIMMGPEIKVQITQIKMSRKEGKV